MGWNRKMYVEDEIFDKNEFTKKFTYKKNNKTKNKKNGKRN